MQISQHMCYRNDLTLLLFYQGREVISIYVCYMSLHSDLKLLFKESVFCNFSFIPEYHYFQKKINDVTDWTCKELVPS